MVRTWRFHCCGPGSIPSQGTMIPQAVRHSQKKKKKIKQNLRDQWAYNKRFNIHTIRVLEGEEKGLQEIMAENSPNLVKDTNL